MAALLAALALLVAGSASAGTGAAAPATLGADVSDAIVTWFIYPDAQEYVAQEVTNPLGAGNSDGEQVADWVCAEKATYNIRGVIAMGDMVKDGASAAEWAVLMRTVAILEACGVPFVPLFGNHESNPVVQRAGVSSDGTLFHTNLGRSVLTARTWWRGEWPVWRESLYLEAASAGARSFTAALPPLQIVAAEWDFGARLVDGRWSGAASQAEPWALGLPKRRPGQLFLLATHAAPCDSINCDLRPQDAAIGPTIFGNANSQMGFSGRGYGWANFIADAGPQYIGFLGGHWNRGFEGCQTGAGSFGTGVRDDLSRWIVGMFDFNCVGRTDPVAGSECDNLEDCSNNPYTWQGWVQLDRQARQLCLQTVRTIDVDADDDGNPEGVAATLRSPPDLDRGSAPWSDPDAADPNSFCHPDLQPRYASGAPTACPNNPRTCVSLPAVVE